MEIIINSSLPAKIDFNYEALKTELSEKLIKYNSLVVTEDSIKIAKEDKASLNVLAKAVNDKRIAEKKTYMIPFDEFEAKMKELHGMITEPINAIDKQLKVFEDKQIAEKKETIKTIYDNIVDEAYRSILPLEKIYNFRWENATYKVKDINTEITDKFEDLTNGLKVIDDLDTEYKQQVKDKFIQTLDIAIALSENKRLKDQAETFRKIQEAKTVKVEQKPVPVVEPIKEPINETVSEPLEEPKKEITYTLDFRVTVTANQLKSLKDYLNSMKIKYGKTD